MDVRVSELEVHLGKTIEAVLDLARMCTVVRYSAGLGTHQWERVERARAVAAAADAALAKSVLGGG